MMPDLTALMQQCAPNVGVVTMRAIVRTESGGNPFILADAGPAHLPWSVRKDMVRTLRPSSAQEAAALVAQLIAEGHIVAIGLTQINAKNLPALGMTVEQALDPCQNLRGGARILTDFYRTALRRFGPANEQAALQAALSAYWSGNMADGFGGGYVQKVLDNAGQPVALRIPSAGQGTVLRGTLGTYRLQAGGRLQPYAPRPAAAVATLAARQTDPRYSPLAAPGFGQQ